MKKTLIQQFEQKQIDKLAESKKEIPSFKVGDTVSVKYKITEGTTTRLQAFQGVVIAKSKDDSNYNATFTVRKISSGVGVERKFVLSSPLVDSVDVMKKGVVRRAKLYYLRKLTGKAARIKEKIDIFGAKSAEKQDNKPAVKAEEKAAAVKAEEVKVEAKAEAKSEEVKAEAKSEEAKS